MNFLYLIILLASLQGIIIAILLLLLDHNKKTNRLLAVVLFLIAIAGINLYLEQSGWYYESTARAIAHALVPGVIIMPVGPLLYFYIRASTDNNFKIGKRHIKHFIPIVIDIVPQLAALLLIASVYAKMQLASVQSVGWFIDQYNVYSDIPRWISLTVYLSAAYKYLKGYPANAKPNQRLLVEKNKWLNNVVRLFLAFQLIWLPYLVFYCIPAFTNTILEKLKWFPVYVPLAALIYYIGLKGYLLSWSGAMTERRSKNALSPDITPSIVNSIIRSMEVDKKYLDPLLDLPALSKHTALPIKTISMVLNQHFKKNFSDYINSYRVAECQQRMNDPALNNLTIIGIATDCGFNASSTFQRVFKEITGLSPSQYRKSTGTETEKVSKQAG